MSFIQNVSFESVRNGTHMNAGDNSMLIQIAEPGYTHPWPKCRFKEVHKFNFYDCDKEWEGSITQEQADELVELLQHAIDEDMNVIVHCAAGISRSGAVCEVGTIMGLEDSGSHRIPNLLVKRKMMLALGLTYD